TVRVAANGDLVWQDLAQPAQGGGTLARPGTYTISASLDGFDSQTRSVFVPVGASNTPLALQLARFGRLQVEVVSQALGGTPVLDPVVTLNRGGSGNITSPAVPGTNQVDFGEMASGTYQIRVQAAGHAMTTTSVTVLAGEAT